MSSADETPELKAGHPPAVKVGGMRVAQPRPRHDSSESKSPPPPSEKKEEDGQEEESEENAVAEKAKAEKLLISGAVADQGRDYPAAAIKAFHDKGHTPNAAYAIRDHANKPQNMVHQPRRQN